MRILIAEDDSDTAEFIQRGLDELGHNAIVAGDGLDALHLLSTESFDVAIVDRMLPAPRRPFDRPAQPERRKSRLPVLLLTALGRIRRPRRRA